MVSGGLALQTGYAGLLRRVTLINLKRRSRLRFIRRGTDSATTINFGCLKIRTGIFGFRRNPQNPSRSGCATQKQSAIFHLRRYQRMTFSPVHLGKTGLGAYGLDSTVTLYAAAVGPSMCSAWVMDCLRASSPAFIRIMPVGCGSPQLEAA